MIHTQDSKLSLTELLDKIDNVAKQNGRDPSDIHLLAVSKGQSTQAIEGLIQQGQLNFGENYLQEAIPKIQLLKYYPVVWHYIGKLQSNKVTQVAKHFSWVHSIDKLTTAEKLSDTCIREHKQLNVCIEVNLYGEISKGGVSVSSLEPMLHAVAALPGLKLRGLMTILPKEVEPKQGFTKLAMLLKHYQQQGFALDTLSMGMSADYEQAIAAGATWIRIGTLLFGSRVLHKI